MRWVMLLATFTYGAAARQVSDATTLWYNHPQSVMQEGTTYFGYVTSKGQVFVQTARLGQLSAPVLLKEWKATNDHTGPSLLVLQNGPNKGRILAVYSGHAGKMYATLSQQPLDITVWTPAVELFDVATYPQLLELPDGGVLIFFRSGRKDFYGLGMLRIPSDMKFSETQFDLIHPTLKTQALYFAAQVRHGRVALAWDSYDIPTTVHRDLYFAYSDTRGRSWRDLNGHARRLADMKPIYQASQQLRVWDLDIQASGSPDPLIGFIEYEKEYEPCCEVQGQETTRVMVFDDTVKQIGESELAYYSAGMAVDKTRQLAIFAKREKTKSSLWVSHLTSGTSCQITNTEGLIRPTLDHDTGQITGLIPIFYKSYNDFQTDLKLLDHPRLNCP